MSFCSRCLGASIGHVLSFLYFVYGNMPSLTVATVAIAIMGTDWSLQRWFGIISNNKRRLFTGILGGFGVGIYVWTAVKYIFLSVCKYF